MKILWVKTELLHPLTKGGRIRTYQMLRSLARHHEITYLCLTEGTVTRAEIHSASEYCSKLITVPLHQPARGSLRFYLGLVRNLFSSLPYAVARYVSPLLTLQVEAHAPGHDVVVCDFLFPSLSISASVRARTVLFQHNVEAQIWERHGNVPQNFLRRAYMRMQWRRMVRYEREQCLRFDHVIAVSEQDATSMRREYGVQSVSFVGTGVDTEYFAPGRASEREELKLLFIGSMDWMPNEDGIMWFIESVFPKLREVVKGVTLTIVGRSPGARVLAATRNARDIEATGTVPDIRPYLASASLTVVPLRIGGGTRIKIFEAMAAGVPVVSTRVGAEGLSVVDGTHIAIADTAEEQVAVISQLLRDPESAGRLSGNARALVEREGSWNKVADDFATMLLPRGT